MSSRVSDQVGLKPACLATEASSSLEISGKEIIDVAKDALADMCLCCSHMA